MQVLASLNRMLESKERREQTRMSNALAMMQYAQQKKMADYQLAASQISILQQANQTVQQKAADQFVSDLGLGAFDMKSEDGAEKAQSYLTSSWSGLGIDKIEANKILSAYSSYQNGNVAPILGMASDLSTLAGKTGLTKAEEKTKKMYKKLGYFEDPTRAKERLDNIQHTLKNADLILKEQYELAKGDTTISKEIKAFGVDTLADAAEEMDAVGKSAIIQSPEEERIKVSQSITSLEEEIEGKNNALANLEKEAKSLKIYKEAGKLSDEQEEYLNRIPAIRGEIEKEIIELGVQIDQDKGLHEMLGEHDKWGVEKKILKGAMEVGKRVPHMGIGLALQALDDPTKFAKDMLEVSQFAPVPGARQLYGYIDSKIDD